VLKIFALAACVYVLFLLSANIYQATFSVRKGLCFLCEGLFVTRDNVRGFVKCVLAFNTD